MKNLLIILFTSLFIISCSSSKSLRHTNTSEKTQNTDTTQKTTISEPIKDKLIINVPKSDNEATNKLLESVLNQLNTSKSSGSNSYKSTYDSETRQLVVDFIVAQSKVEQTNTSSETSFTSEIDSYIEKKIKRIPWWLYVAVGLYFMPKILDFILRIVKLIRI